MRLALLVLAACTETPKLEDDTGGAPVDDCPVVSIDHTTLVWVDASAAEPQALTLANACAGETALDVTVTQSGSGAYTLSTTALSLLPGAIGSIVVTYTPLGPADAGTLLLATNDPDRPEIAVTLSGGALADADGDGSPADEDCDDADASAYPGATEIWYDGIDQACDGGSDYDRDADGLDATLYAGTDCDDGDASVSPGAPDPWYDGVDSDCAGDDDFDADADGFVAAAYAGDDCDDTDAAVHPGAPDQPADGIDADCNGSDADADGDGFDGAAYGGDDCDDDAATVYPGAPDVPYDGVDADCSGSDYDADGDGFLASAYGGDDCDDASATTFPGAVDGDYDGIDADCAGDSDYDADGDGYDYGVDDCDDAAADVHPGAVETWYDGVDADCDGGSDYDGDGDGYDAGVDDCDDSAAGIHPGAAETWYDAIDGDCDGADDFDQDRDGARAFPTGDDCDDTDASTTTGPPESRNGLDDDCDGYVDEGLVDAGDVAITEVMVNPDAVSDTVGEWFEVFNAGSYDVDLNGWVVYSDDGSSFTIGSSIALAPGDYAVLGASGDPAANGGVAVDYAYSRIGFALAEAGDSIYLVAGAATVAEVSFPASWGASAGAAMQLDPDHADPAELDWWCVATDAFGDGDLGTPGGDNAQCDFDEDGDGWSPPGGDCADDDADVSPDAFEGLDGIDNDCDGVVDDGAADDDVDGWSENEGDCDDADPAVSPVGSEICNGIDDDCDGATDPEGTIDCVVYYADTDGDGYGSSAGVCACAETGSYTSATADDCYDSNSSASPAAITYSTSQRGDGSYDWNCDGVESGQYTGTASCSGWPFCSGSDGWAGGVASCGTSDDYQTACWTDWFGCSETTTTVTQPCL